MTVIVGVSVMGLGGSMIKDLGSHDLLGGTPSLLLWTRQVTAPKAGTVLIGVFFILFAQILYVLSSPDVHPLMLLQHGHQFCFQREDHVLLQHHATCHSWLQGPLRLHHYRHIYAHPGTLC